MSNVIQLNESSLRIIVIEFAEIVRHFCCFFLFPIESAKGFLQVGKNPKRISTGISAERRPPSLERIFKIPNNFWEIQNNLIISKRFPKIQITFLEILISIFF